VKHNQDSLKPANLDRQAGVFSKVIYSQRLRRKSRYNFKSKTWGTPLAPWRSVKSPANPLGETITRYNRPTAFGGQAALFAG
jgi:hypothetical protein